MIRLYHPLFSNFLCTYSFFIKHSLLYSLSELFPLLQMKWYNKISLTSINVQNIFFLNPVFIVILCFTPHIYFTILISMITSNLVEIIRLHKYRTENVFGSLISARLDLRDYQLTTSGHLSSLKFPDVLMS